MFYFLFLQFTEQIKIPEFQMSSYTFYVCRSVQ